MLYQTRIDIRFTPAGVASVDYTGYITVPTAFWTFLFHAVTHVSCNHDKSRKRPEYNNVKGNFYRPQTKLCEGNVFTGVCLSTGDRV